MASRSSSAGRPTSDTRPSSRQETWSAAASAWLMSCSTTSSVVPGVADRRQRRVQLLDDDRRQAERHLVEQQQRRVAHQPRPIASACCSPPDSRAAERPTQRARAAGTWPRPARLVHGPGRRRVGADAQVLLDRQAGEDPPPLRDEGDAARHPLVGRHVRSMRSPVEADLAGADRQQRRRSPSAASTCRRRWRRSRRPSRPRRRRCETSNSAWKSPYPASTRSTSSSVIALVRAEVHAAHRVGRHDLVRVALDQHPPVVHRQHPVDRRGAARGRCARSR